MRRSASLCCCLATSAAGNPIWTLRRSFFTYNGQGRQKASKCSIPGRKACLVSPAASLISASGVAVGGESALATCCPRLVSLPPFFGSQSQSFFFGHTFLNVFGREPHPSIGPNTLLGRLVPPFSPRGSQLGLSGAYRCIRTVTLHPSLPTGSPKAIAEILRCVATN